MKTPVEGVRFFRATEPVTRTPLLYEPGIVLIGQGHKIGYLDGQRFRYDAENYLVLSVPLPFECETHASPDAPLLGIFIDIDVVRLRETAAVVEREHPPAAIDVSSVRRGVEPAPLDPELLATTARLLQCLKRPLDARVLGPSIVHEILYRVLLGPHGSALFALTQHSTPYARIARALSFAHRHYHESISVETLARQAAMSTSAFHRAFKRVTGESPLQYVKKLRLNKARTLLVHQDVAVSDAAFQVGYESPAQFSRDFRRYFGAPPSQARGTGYSLLSSGRS